MAEAAGIELIPAIEMTTRWPGVGMPVEYSNIDMLGYFVDFSDPVFAAFTEALLADHHDRMRDACAMSVRLGFPISMDELWAQNPRYAGALQMVQVIQKKGYAGAWDEGLRLMELIWYEARLPYTTIRAAIEQVHLAGGVAVLAHPTIVCPRGERLAAGDLRELVDAGLDGIEVFHPRLNLTDRAYFSELAREFGLLVTGGSDTHGWSRGLDELGTQPVTEDMLEKLRAKHKPA